MQVPDAFLREVVDFALPPAGAYAVGTAFLPMDEQARAIGVGMIEEIAAEEGLTVLGWRERSGRHRPRSGRAPAA